MEPRKWVHGLSITSKKPDSFRLLKLNDKNKKPLLSIFAATVFFVGLSNIVYKYTLITLAIGNIRISLCGYGNKVLLPSCHNSADDILLLPRK